MHQVGIVFKNGSNTTFEAQEFDIDIAKDSSGGIRYNDVNKFSYKDVQDNESPIYLNPSEVAGIAVVATVSATPQSRSLQVH